jgi:hypothetical protein
VAEVHELKGWDNDGLDAPRLTEGSAEGSTSGTWMVGCITHMAMHVQCVGLDEAVVLQLP